MVLDCPCEPEQADWEEHGSNVGEGQSVLGLAVVPVRVRELVVDLVDPRDCCPGCGQEAEGGSEVG